MEINNLIHNFNIKNNISLPNNYEKFINDIKDTISDQRSLKIIGNMDLLQEIIDETRKFSENKNTFLIFGTGGSNLGSQALINILQGKNKKHIFFFDNIDPINFQNRIEKIDLMNAGIIIISKSGHTPETLSQYSALIEIFEQKNCLNILFKNSLVITEDKSSPLKNIAHAHNCKILNHDKDIGGRFSLFSNVGMIPAIIAGLDVKKIHEGALYGLKTFSINEYIKIGQIFRFQKSKNKLNNSVLMTYSDALYYFAKWYLQLWAESIGKNSKGITPIHAVGTTDQHSQLQLYIDGPKDKFFTFYTTNHSKLGFKLNYKIMNENNVQYLSDKTMGDLMQAEQKATIETFKKNNLPYREIYIEKINEFSIGKLMTFSILETISTCMFYDVNPFNQPAVEQGKILTKEYLI